MGRRGQNQGTRHKGTNKRIQNIEYRIQKNTRLIRGACFDSRTCPAPRDFSLRFAPFEMTSAGETCPLVRQSFCCCVLRIGRGFTEGAFGEAWSDSS